MNSNKICNSKTEVPIGMNLNDKDYMNCLLSSLKDMLKNYTVALTEASNENLYDRYKSMFDGYATLQREVFELMFRKGWYCLEKSELQKINDKFQTLSQELSDLNQ